jgi:hypothetical protein
VSRASAATCSRYWKIPGPGNDESKAKTAAGIAQARPGSPTINACFVPVWSRAPGSMRPVALARAVGWSGSSTTQAPATGAGTLA